MKPSIPKAVPTAVVSSTDNSAPVLTGPVMGPYQPATGSSINPKVPRTEIEGETPNQPYWTGGYVSSGGQYAAGSMGAPSLPTDGFLFKRGPIDAHYTEMDEGRNPYGTVGRPGTYGWYTRLQNFQNNIRTNQDTDNAGWRVRHAQQRTSYMRNALPPIGAFGTQTFQPHQQPQAVRYNRIVPRVGTDKYGTGVLNADTFGAGQTYGGQGGSNYTPAPGPPVTNSITNPPVTTEPTWG